MPDLSQSERSERELTAIIASAEERLDDLYRHRAGRLVDGIYGVGWCVGCGQAQVNCSEGYDTCPRCLNG